MSAIIKTDNKWTLYYYLFLPVMIFSILLAWGFYQFELKSRLNITKTTTENHVELQVRTIALTFHQIFSDLKFLSKQQGLLDYLDDPSILNQQNLANDYFTFSQQKIIYDQIRFLDESGQEQVRVNFNKGSVHIVANNKLQNKGKRYYFMDAYELSRDAIFVSPFDLNIEQGQIEQPVKPMIRFGMPVFDRQGNKRGIILLNYLGNELLNRFRNTAKDLAGTVSLINREGYSLSSNNLLSDWLFMYPDKKQDAFAKHHQAIWKQLNEAHSGQFQYAGQLITFNTVTPLEKGIISSTGSDKANTASLHELHSHDYFWKVISTIDRNDPALSSLNTIIVLISFSSFISLLALAGSWALTHSRIKLTYSAKQLSLKVDELEHTRDQLIQSEKMASIGRMVAGFAHEVNTPVGIAVGATSQIQSAVNTLEKLLTQDEVEEEELLQEIGVLQDSTHLTLNNLNRAANLVNSFKRSTVDQTSNQDRFFNPAQMIDDVLSGLKNKLKRTNIIINVECSKKLKIKNKPGLFDQLFTNLIINSFIHAFDNGKTTGQIDIVIDIEKEKLHIVYKDNGKGMSQNTLEKIFEPFFTTDRVNGTGLGLYLCYNIITTELKGDIICQSEPGQGVQYDIYIPVNLTT